MSSSDDPYTLNSTQKALRSVIIASISITGAFIATRCWIRARLQIQFSVDDYLLVTAFIIFILQTCFGLFAMDYGGFGRKTSDLSKDVYNMGLKWLVLTQCTYTLALMFAKLSIGLLQLRVMGLSTMTLRRMHYGSIAVNIAVGLNEFFMLLLQCYPNQITGEYQPVIITNADCTDRNPILISVYVYSGVNIVLDWYYSLAMVPLIWRLQNMKTIVKISAIIILGMGIFASIATIVRLKYLVGFADSSDPLLAIVPIGLLSWIEECLGMCAACIATFRPLLRLVPGLTSSRGGGVGGVGLDRPYRSGENSGEGQANMFVTWKSRLHSSTVAAKGRRARAKGVDGLRMHELELGYSEMERSVDDDGDDRTRVHDEESGRRRPSDARGAVDVRHSDDAIRTNRYHPIDEETTTTTTSSGSGSGKDTAEIQTVLDDADSQKSILQHKSESLLTAGESWRK
ncbi:Integral membrane protein [Lasiodiplodia theobromae]|uniref:Rhodopsin domain-containing protein n=1 Tax=Lasiodiplodia theobromae TaxID=45133 RepID=A0A5N5DA12_9PEZI|nr:Integral membrane protein [Lasiodiplodia theobromae]KAB2574457.1 hypothetical protein DBV05_g6846 [Lasiodiplodia theobromae]KAF4536907.1 Integral membrane protein [Lasiodiplodia theobromae]